MNGVQVTLFVGIVLVCHGCIGASFGSSSGRARQDRSKDALGANGVDDNQVGRDAGDGGADSGADGGVDGEADGRDGDGVISESPEPGESTVDLSGAEGAEAGEGGSAQVAFDDGTVRREVFAYGEGAKPPLVDYLFIVDNSPSMGNNVAQLQAGVASLAPDLFPAKARIAVMSTMPGKPGALDQSLNGSEQESLAAANAEPGFLRLITKATIAAYKQAGGGAGPFPSEGCDDAWFAPDAKDAAGGRCFDAATQISLKGGPCEAGIVAIDQILEKSAAKRLFRKAAVAHVVFVSDTQDPGCPGANGATLKGLQKSHAELEKAAAKNSPDLAKLRFDAIAPTHLCPGQGSEGASHLGNAFPYHDLAKASGGESVDLCSTSDFKGVLEAIVGSTDGAEPLFQLTVKARKILSVSVDGVETEDYAHRDGDLLEVNGLSPTDPVRIQVIYLPEVAGND